MRGYILVALNLFCQDLGQGDILPLQTWRQETSLWCAQYTPSQEVIDSESTSRQHLTSLQSILQNDV